MSTTATAPNPMSQRELQSLKTRTALVAAARKLFTEKGYHGAGTHEIVALANVTRGALAHYFPRKEDLFLAVFEAVQNDLMARVPEPDAQLADAMHWRAFRLALHALLDSATDPEVQRILLLDGPVVLGWTQWRQIESGYLKTVQAAVEQAMHAGLIRNAPVQPLAHLILAAHNEAVMLIAHAKEPKKIRAEAEQALNALLGNLEDPG